MDREVREATWKAKKNCVDRRAEQIQQEREIRLATSGLGEGISNF